MHSTARHRWRAAAVAAFLGAGFLGCSGAGVSYGHDAHAPSESSVDGPDGAGGPYFPFFTEIAGESGLDYVQWNFYSVAECSETRPQAECGMPTLTGGAAVGDYDGDGWDDIYVTRADGHGILFRNRGDGTFEDKTMEAGLGLFHFTNGAAFADIDDDGDLDLYVTVAGGDEYYLYINDGNGRFDEQATERGLAIRDLTGAPRSGMSACFGDYDGDGWIDVHTTEWLRLWDGQGHPNGTRLFRNRGASDPGHFDDVTDAAGVALEPLLDFHGIAAFGSVFTDLDRDGLPDLLVVSDFEQTQLFWNEGDGTFSHGNADLIPTDENGMGFAVGDFDGSGDLSIFVTSVYDDRYPCIGCGQWGVSGNRMYRNLGQRMFEDATDEFGVRDGGWGWGAAAFDYDNDGDLDLVMANGYLLDGEDILLTYHQERTRFWRNDGSAPMQEIAAQIGLAEPDAGKALLVFDFDQDGDLDVFVVINGGTPRLYRNDGPTGNYLRIKARGRGARNGGTNRQGLGAWVEVRVRPGDPPMVREMGNCTFLGTNENVAHFGLGDAESVHEVRVRWPVTGEESVLNDVPANQVLMVHEPG
jgi:enediyne biosynthesis protein E4